MALKAYSLARDGALHLTPHFRVREFACRDGSDPIFVEEELAALLEAIRLHFGCQRGGSRRLRRDPAARQRRHRALPAPQRPRLRLGTSGHPQYQSPLDGLRAAHPAI